MPLGNAGRSSCHVRRDDHIFHAPQRMVLGERLDLEDIEPGPGNQPLLKRAGQVNEIDDYTAADGKPQRLVIGRTRHGLVGVASLVRGSDIVGQRRNSC